MPRRRSGDRNLRRRLRESKGTALPTDLQNYLDYLQGKRSITVDNPAPDGAKDLYALYLLPFSRDYDAAGTNTRFIVGGSGYAMNMWFGTGKRINVTNADALLGHDADAAEKTAAVPQDGFYPALCRVTVSRGTAAVTSRTSGKTGESYDYKARRTSQMPFGRNKTTPEEDYLERKKAIATELSALDPKPSFGFEAEVLRETPVPEVEFNPSNTGHNVDVD